MQYNEKKEVTGSTVTRRYIAIFVFFSLFVMISSIFDFPDDYLIMIDHILSYWIIYLIGSVALTGFLVWLYIKDSN